MIKDDILISVCMITYNHEDYIRQAIDSIVNQKCNYNIELVIGDDFSTDNTKLICEEYIEKHPDWIRLLPSEKNLGAIPNFIRTLKSCKGKYISICEGDDFWIDPFKLQKQVDFLEANINYSLCFHDAMVCWENKSLPPYNFCTGLFGNNFYAKDVINNWLMPSASMVFRSESLFPLPYWFKDIYNGDYAIQLLLVTKGDFYFIDEVMSVYRQHSTNLSATANNIEINKSIFRLLILFDEYSNYKYSVLIKVRLKKLNIYTRIYKAKSICFRLPFGITIWKSVSRLFRLLKKK